MAKGPNYCPFFPWRWHVLLLQRFKRHNGHISAPGPQIKKLRTLSFLQLLKFEKAKYPYFFDLWPRGQDIGILSTWRYRVLLLQCKFWIKNGARKMTSNFKKKYISEIYIKNGSRIHSRQKKIWTLLIFAQP